MIVRYLDHEGWKISPSHPWDEDGVLRSVGCALEVVLTGYDTALHNTGAGIIKIIRTSVLCLKRGVGYTLVTICCNEVPGTPKPVNPKPLNRQP